MESLPPHRTFYDAERRRLWLFGQRCHHGATGVLLTGVAVAGLGANRLKSASLVVTLAATGSVLMLHDWKDRQIWFERGWGTQP
jgi:hypothetical protein